MYTHKDITAMLQFRGEAQEGLFQEARRLRQSTFGNQIIVRGVIEITNLCRVNCDYCPMRRDNSKENTTYIMEQDEILDIAKQIKQENINIVFLQGGEIPQTTRLVGELLPKIRMLFDDQVEILLCLGNKSKEEYAYLKRQGADSYILKHETSDPDLHAQIRHTDFQDRIQCLEDLLDLGYKVGTGTIVGLPGQSIESIVDDILLGQRLGVHMMSASPFVPAPNTPLQHHEYGSADITLNTMAVARILNPTWLIPSVSALEKTQKGGQLQGLEAGANVLTVNFTPNYRREDYLIYGKNRFVVKTKHVDLLLNTVGLEPSSSCWTKENNTQPIRLDLTVVEDQ